MIRHIVMWNYAEGFSPEENADNFKRMKLELENLVSIIDGLISLTVSVNTVGTGNRDIVLDSVFESEEALRAYIDHPEHVRAGAFVRSVTQDRASADFMV